MIADNLVDVGHGSSFGRENCDATPVTGWRRSFGTGAQHFAGPGAQLLASTDIAEGTSHSISNMPIIIAGKAGGRLKGNVHVNMGGGSVWVAGATICEALGMTARPFEADPVSALLA